MEHFSTYLRRRMDELAVTPRQMLVRLHRAGYPVQRPALSRWLHGKRIPGRAHEEEIAKALDVPLDTLAAVLRYSERERS